MFYNFGPDFSIYLLIFVTRGRDHRNPHAKLHLFITNFLKITSFHKNQNFEPQFFTLPDVFFNQGPSESTSPCTNTFSGLKIIEKYWILVKKR